VREPAYSTFFDPVFGGIVHVASSGEGFDVVYDTVGAATIDASFIAVKRYTGHVISCLGWSTHSLASLSFRGATYSGAAFDLSLPFPAGKTLV